VRVIEVEDLSGTEALGRRLGGLLFPGAIVCLDGRLGAGKTHLTRAVAEGAGVTNPAAVCSPTFTLVHEYPGRLPVYHFDAYRLRSGREFVELGADEYLAGDGVCVIEWAEKVADVLPAERLEVVIEGVGECGRRFTLTPRGVRYEAVIASLVPPGSASPAPAPSA
jgi:tRNA threonylcarbamoyladenosine biosynthesis protein TsaE